MTMDKSSKIVGLLWSSCYRFVLIGPIMSTHINVPTAFSAIGLIGPLSVTMATP